MKKFSLSVLSFMLALTLAGCASKPDSQGQANVNLDDIAGAVSKKIESGDIAMGMGMPLDDASLKDLYDIDASNLEAYHVEIPMMNVHASEYAMFKVKEGHMDEVKKGVEYRIEALKQTWSQYLPDQYAFVKNYKTYETGNYYFMVINEDPEAVLKVIKDAFK